MTGWLGFCTPVSPFGRERPDKPRLETAGRELVRFPLRRSLGEPPVNAGPILYPQP